MRFSAELYDPATNPWSSATDATVPTVGSHMQTLDKAINRYGGLETWKRVECVIARVAALGGVLPLAKGLGRTFPRPGVVSVFPHRFRTEFQGYPSPGHKGVFDNGRVAVLDAEGSDAFALDDYRLTFNGLRKYRRWDPLDALYFFGYAITTYLSVPFLLASLKTKTTPWGRGFRVSARFPLDLPTRSPKQDFFFDEEGLLVRHDYHAEIVGWWAHGAHFTRDYETVSGLPIARHRDVFARIGAVVTPIPVLSARIEPIEVQFKSATSPSQPQGA